MEVEKADYLQEVVGDDDIRVSNMEFLRQKAMGFGNATPGEQGHERAQGGGGGQASSTSASSSSVGARV